MMVQRYEPSDLEIIGMRRDDDGDYVDYSDYAALEQRVRELAAEHSANARLIAAAAELLDALEWLNAEFECRDDEFGGVLFTRNDFERVRKAIAKAEGGKDADHE
jgi:hypothetical protein